MKTHYLISILVFLTFFSGLQAQNSAPVAVNDTITVNSGETYTFSPWANDYDPDGDPFLILNANFKHGKGFVDVSYSSITIHMNYATGVDTIEYLLKDNHNNVSAPGLIFVSINNNHISDTLTINNVRAPFLPTGNDFWNKSGSYGSFEVPAGSGKTTIFTSVPWIGALDPSGNLHLAAGTYNHNGSDYFYGPVCDPTTLYQYSDSLWNRVWKISKSEIDNHKNNYWKSSYIIPEAIANWPAKGDTQLGQNVQMAPFIDHNNDGKYVPSDGDYPKIRGDQSVFLIFNDSKKAHSESLGLPLGVEIHEWAYAYDCPGDTALNNTIFVHYDIYNRSTINYHDMYLGIWTDFDIGYAYDDYVGCDTSRNLFYAYNGKAIDGLGYPDHYGANPPAQGLIYLSESMSSFMASGNTGYNPQQIDPSTDAGFYNYMKAIWSDGSHLTYGGNGYQGTHPTNFAYSGDPNDSLSWSEIHPFPNSTNAPYDRRGIGSIGPFNLNAGAVKSLDFAYVYARDITKSNIENVSELKLVVDKIQFYYDNDSTPCGGSFTAIAKVKTTNNSLRIYPVPADELITIEYLPSTTTATYEVYNIAGQRVQSGIFTKELKHQFIISNYKSGLYILLIHDQQQALSRRFIVR